MSSEPVYMLFFARVAEMLNTLRDVPGQRSVLVAVKQCLGRWPPDERMRAWMGKAMQHARELSQVYPFRNWRAWLGC